MTKRERAIEIVEDSRRSHVSWMRWQEKERRAGRDWKRRTRSGNVGGPSFHRQCVKRYDLVLEVLRGGAE